MKTPHRDSIIITAGGTGGHVIPALALRTELQKQGYNSQFIADERGYAYISNDQRRDTHILTLPRYQGSWSAFVQFAIKLILAMIQCLHILQVHKAAVIVSFGGYVTLPTLLAAIILRKTIILHEQNTVLGRVNRWFGRFATIIAVSTPEVLRCPLALRPKFVITGLPLREDMIIKRPLLLATPLKNEVSERFTMLITGGSQGASFFSTMIPSALLYVPEYLRQRLQIYHQCPSQDQAGIEAFYKDHKICSEVYPYFQNIYERLQTADLVFARAGASSIAEASLLNKAVLLVPLPHAMDDHQTMNAYYATRQGGGWYRDQNRITALWLGGFITRLMTQPQALKYAGDMLHRYHHHDAAKRLTQVVLEYC